jgi:hypothetical protein
MYSYISSFNKINKTGSPLVCIKWTKEDIRCLAISERSS